MRIWHTRSLAVLGTLFACATAPVAYWHHHFQPWSLIEPALFTLGLVYILSERKHALALLILPYTLVRETGIMLALAYGLFHLEQWQAELTKPLRLLRRREFNWFLIYVGIWGATYGCLRLLLGGAPHVISMVRLIEINFSSSNLIKFLLYIFIMFGGFLWFAKSGLTKAPNSLKRLSRVIIPYGMFMGIWSIWIEVRCFMSLYPLIIALGLFSIKEWFANE